LTTKAYKVVHLTCQM